MPTAPLQVFFYIVLSGSSGEVQTGTSYIRWGRKTCESSASLVYAGNNQGFCKDNADCGFSLLVIVM